MRKYLILLCVLALICGTVVYARMNVGILGGSVPTVGGSSPPTYANSGSGYVAANISVACSAMATTSTNAIVVFTGNGNTQTVTGVADTALNSYVKIAGVWSPSGDYRNEAWLAQNITGHGTNVITVTFSDTAADGICIAAEYSGVATSSAHDSDYAPSVVADDSSSPFTSGSDSTTVDNDVVVGFIYNMTTTDTYSNGTTGTYRHDLVDVWVIVDKTAASAGAHTIDVAGTASVNHAIMAVALKPQ